MSRKNEFAIFCLESYREHKSLSGKEAFELFEKYQVFDYLTENFDVLHTTGYQYMNEDIDSFLKARMAV